MTDYRVPGELRRIADALDMRRAYPESIIAELARQ